jgi:hypothetical protein
VIAVASRVLPDRDGLLAQILDGAALHRIMRDLALVIIACAAAYGAVLGMWHGMRASCRTSGPAGGVEEKRVMEPSIDVRPPPPTSVLGSMDELLRRPRAGFERAEHGVRVSAWGARVGAGSLGCCVPHGAASGLFAGGTQIGLAAVKAPLVVAWSALPCVPSLYVFGVLAGAPFTRARFVVTLVGFVGMLALVLVGLLPIEWLFSVSSRSLTFAIGLHLLLWGSRSVRRPLSPRRDSGDGDRRRTPLAGPFLRGVVSGRHADAAAALARAGSAGRGAGQPFFLEHFSTSVQ